MHKIIQVLVQIVFLALFIALIALDLMQMWLGVFALALLSALLFSRFYCGWLCPINTIMKAVEYLRKTFRIPRFSTPNFLKRNSIRYSFLGVFVVAFLFVIVTGRQIPVLPGLLILGALVTLLFEESLFHRYLCPYGTLLKALSKKSKRAMIIDEETCTNCGLCKKACPTEAIEKLKHAHHIHIDECLVCHNCSRVCPVDAIRYQSS